MSKYFTKKEQDCLLKKMADLDSETGALITLQHYGMLDDDDLIKRFNIFSDESWSEPWVVLEENDYRNLMNIMLEMEYRGIGDYEI